MALQHPLPKTSPSWLPGDDYYTNFHEGDPFIKIDEGYAPLPGAGYEALHPELKDVNPQDYPDIHKMAILADVAPYSREYNTYRQRVGRQAQDNQIKLQRAQERLRQVEREKHTEELANELERSAERDHFRILELQLKDDFLSHVSHELRTPLAAIRSFNAIIADGLAGETTADQDEYLSIINRNVLQLQCMVEDLLQVSQGQMGKLSIDLQRVPLSLALGDAVHSLQPAATVKGISLSFDPSRQLLPVFADSVRLCQVLTILIDNAIKFTPNEGSVTVQANVFERDSNFMQVQIADTGCGISPELTGRIFERMYQATVPGQEGRRGLGLGLYIAKELVTRQGGEIWVNREPQRGSQFSFTLPVFSDAPD